jgi:hypothetical protein
MESQFNLTRCGLPQDIIGLQPMESQLQPNEVSQPSQISLGFRREAETRLASNEEKLCPISRNVAPNHATYFVVAKE